MPTHSFLPHFAQPTYTSGNLIVPAFFNTFLVNSVSGGKVKSTSGISSGATRPKSIFKNSKKNVPHFHERHLNIYLSNNYFTVSTIALKASGWFIAKSAKTLRF